MTTITQIGCQYGSLFLVSNPFTVWMLFTDYLRWTNFGGGYHLSSQRLQSLKLPFPVAIK